MRTKKQIKGDNYERTVAKILMNPNLSWTSKKIVFDIQQGPERLVGISSLKHQIDIHLTSSNNPEYHLICECKCYKEKVGKQKASAFFGIYNDIKKKHKDWKIIAVYASDESFTRDAIKMLVTNNIGIIDLKDVSRRVVQLQINESYTRPDIAITKVKLKDGTIAKKTDFYRNDDRGDFFDTINIIRSFELFDENGRIIKELSSHLGFFKTGKQIVKHSEYDVFYRTSDGIEISEIEGVVRGQIKKEYGPNTNLIKSNVDGILTIPGYRCIFYKDGSIKKEAVKKAKNN